MRVLFFGAALAFASASAVMADDTTMTPTTPATPAPSVATGSDPMVALYGNTIIVKGAGPESHTRYSADHTFEGIAPEYNYPYKGTWEITADGRLCRTYDPAVPTVSNPDCDPAPPAGHAVGDTWTTDKGATISIVAGIQ
jgi:hypothetical protein